MRKKKIYPALYTLGIFPAKWWLKENIKLINVDTAEQFGVTVKLLGGTKGMSSESILPEQITTYLGEGNITEKLEVKYFYVFPWFISLGRLGHLAR